jgi:1,4-dihydroxy-2-naphthoate polyprenyltransferase
MINTEAISEQTKLQNQSGHWIEAARPRTLPLALASILMGSFLAANFGTFNWLIFALTVLTTVFLQILSNFANDYGDAQNGADLAGRQGPTRAVASGQISKQQMLKAIILFVILALVSGIILLYLAFKGADSTTFYSFLGLGLLSIFAAITYTAGKNPYGYAGFGDISVLIFFGLLGVGGTCFLQIKTFDFSILLPALTSGFFATAVLNINNLRDIESDERAGKKTIPVRFGKAFGVRYHQFLIFGGLICAIIYSILNYQSLYQFLFLVTTPILVLIAKGIKVTDPPQKIDTFLKKMALTSLLFSVLFGVGLLVAGSI